MGLKGSKFFSVISDIFVILSFLLLLIWGLIAESKEEFIVLCFLSILAEIILALFCIAGYKLLSEAIKED